MRSRAKRLRIHKRQRHNHGDVLVDRNIAKYWHPVYASPMEMTETKPNMAETIYQVNDSRPEHINDPCAAFCVHDFGLIIKDTTMIYMKRRK